MKQKAVVLIFALLVISNNLIAQKQLILENTKLNKTVVIESLDYVNIQYSGYLNQLEESKTNILDVTDSSLVFKNIKGTDYLTDRHEVLNSDITGFRKFWKFQPLVKPLTSVSVSIGSFYAFKEIEGVSEVDALIYASLAGVATNYILDFIFDEKIEYKIADGWNLRVGATVTQ